MFATGGVEAALRAMAAHADCEEVQEFGCGMLANVTAGDDNARTEAAIAAGLVDAVLKALGSSGPSADSVALQEGGMWALFNVFAGNSNVARKRAAQARSRGVPVTAVAATATAVKRAFADNEELVAEADDLLEALGELTRASD